MSTTKNFQIRLDEDLIKRIDANLPLIDARSRNEYITKAVQFYNVYLQALGETDAFTKVVSGIVGRKITVAMAVHEKKRRDDVEHINRNLYKTAVTVTHLNKILGASLNIDHSLLDSLYAKSVQEVNKTSGTLSFTDALEYE